MANSVVKVTDSMLNDSLLLLVGEDGTVTPDRETVETYLKSQNGATNIQVMHVNKSDGQGIDVSIDNLTYIHDADETSGTSKMEDNDILRAIKLDHDYTPLRAPSRDDYDELTKTLSILDGGSVENINRHARKPQTIVKHRERMLKTPQKPTVKNKLPPAVMQRPETQYKPVEDDDDEEEDEYGLDEERRKMLKKPVKKVPPPNYKVMKKLEVPQLSKEDPTKIVRKPPPELVDPKAIDKKTPKKDKKPAKPIPDDFALFSTPDIIRRVGGKDGMMTPEMEQKPAKINETRTSTSSRVSTDSRSSTEKIKPKIKKKDDKPAVRKLSTGQNKSDASTEGLDAIDDLQAIIANESKQFNLTPTEMPTEQPNLDQNLDTSGLALDPALLDNINNDLISEDILYQVAQSLVSNTELQNVIDKGLNDGNLVLDPNIIGQEQQAQPNEAGTVQALNEAVANQKGTHIVRPDGRVVIIPPIERPTTRSRNKKKEEDKLALKFTHKPLDEEHVSGNELDSSNAEEEEEEEDDEEESEDDPNKLWCICNQPHNNRFMICCDTCEEWYHGKCVNITKAMGQQMEAEGKEWICLFCKDPSLKRPQAAARRIRKASRNSRQSSDSTGSAKKPDTPAGSVPCIVCQKASRINSIFCSESCILAHAQGVERVVVFERRTGNMLTGDKAPSAANLEQWLRDHPGYEVFRSAGKVVTTKTQTLTQSKLKLVKNADNDGVSLAVHKKGVNVGLLKHFPKNSPQVKGFRMISKQVNAQQKVKVIPPLPKLPPGSSSGPSTPTTPRPKPMQNLPKPSPSTSAPKDRPMPLKTPKSRQAELTRTAQPKQGNIRDNIQKTICSELLKRSKNADEPKVTEDEVKQISAEIESQLYKCFGDTGQKYRNKYRSLIFNIKDEKNHTLWKRICEKSINPYQLVRLSSDDLASQELALWREREAKHQLDMITKSEMENLNCSRQLVLKTHKGEQVLEDNRPSDVIDNTEVITNLGEAGEGGEVVLKVGDKKDDKHDKKGSTNKHAHRDRERRSSKEKEHHRSRSHDHSRKRSKSRERKHGDRKRSRSRERHRRSSHKSSRHRKDMPAEKLDRKSKEILEQLVDNKILPVDLAAGSETKTAPAESDSDHEPSSTVTIPTPPRVNEPEEQPETSKEEKSGGVKQIAAEDRPTSPKAIWKGIINMIEVAQISILAEEVSGDCNGLGNDLPPKLDIVGRISEETVWDYIGKMKCSNSKNISLLRLKAVNTEEKMPYLALYSYLSSRERLGVVKSTNMAVKDFYIYPLAPRKPIPQVLLPINGPGFEESRPALLLGIIVRDKRKRLMLDSSSATTRSYNKKAKTDAAAPARSYTPPPMKETSRHKLPLPTISPATKDEDEDEPYSPEDSDPDTGAPELTALPATATAPSTNNAGFLETAQPFQPFSNKFDDIPGLGNPTTLPSSTQEIERQMEELNKKIEMQKSEINNISKNIVTASTEIGSSALANIAIPSDLQQILDSIKTIGATSSSSSAETAKTEVVQFFVRRKPIKTAFLQTVIGVDGEDEQPGASANLTIPLMIPKTYARSHSTDTIPLNLPANKKPATKSSDTEKSGSVLSSLSEEELIRKAAEMLGDVPKSNEKKKSSFPTTNELQLSTAKRAKLDFNQPPVPGLEDEDI